MYTLAETGGIMITPRPSTTDTVPKPGYPMTPFFGIEPVLVDEHVSTAYSVQYESISVLTSIIIDQYQCQY